MKKYIVVDGKYEMEYHFALKNIDGSVKKFDKSGANEMIENNKWFYKIEAK